MSGIEFDTAFHGGDGEVEELDFDHSNRSESVVIEAEEAVLADELDGLEGELDAAGVSDIVNFEESDFED